MPELMVRVLFVKSDKGGPSDFSPLPKGLSRTRLPSLSSPFDPTLRRRPEG